MRREDHESTKLKRHITLVIVDITITQSECQHSHLMLL